MPRSICFLPKEVDDSLSDFARSELLVRIASNYCLTATTSNINTNGHNSYCQGCNCSLVVDSVG